MSWPLARGAGIVLLLTLPMSATTKAGSRPPRECGSDSLFWRWPASFAPPILAGLAMGALALRLIAALRPNSEPDPLSGHLLPWARQICVDDQRDQFLYHAGVALTALFGLALAWLYSRVGARRHPRVIPHDAGNPTAAPPSATAGSRHTVWAALASSRVTRTIMHIVAVGAIFSLLYVPDYAWLAGTFWVKERFHHWYFFAVMPTHAYLFGRVPVLESYSQYGIGIPVIFGMLCRLIGDFSHATVVWLGVTYSVAYFVGLYALFWLWLKSWPWSVTGVAVALLLQQFGGMGPGETLWQCPSSTILRSPLDVWLFLALTGHTRRGGWRYLVAGALLVGFAIYWETDTGLYLAVGLAAYAGYWFLDEVTTRGWSRPVVRRYLGTFAVIPATCLVLVGLSVGGAVAAPLFWVRLLEPLRLFQSGFGMLPMPAPAMDNLHLFLTPGLYVFVAVLALAAALGWTGRPWRDGYLLGAVGVYGLGFYHQYVGRSHPFNWFHVCIPVVIVATVLGCVLLRGLELRVRAGTGRGLTAVRLMPVILMATALALLATAPTVKGYPGVLSGKWQMPGILWDLPGADFRMPAMYEAERSRVETVVVAIQAKVPENEPVAILSERDGLFYVLANRKPFSRFVPLYPSVALDSELQEVIEALADPAVNYVFVERSLGLAAWQRDVPTALFLKLNRDFQLVDQVDTFQILRRRHRAHKP